MKCLRIIVSGKVQGVYFRANTQQKALELGVKGYVKNLTDGSVLIEAEGNATQLQQLVEWCHKEPGNSTVSSVITKETEPRHHASFDIRK